MKLLIESFDANNQILEEASGKGKRYIVEGICIQAEVLNGNKRIYPKAVIKPEVERYIREDIQKNRAIGHLNHPKDDPSNDYTKASHKFESLVESGNNWIARATVMKHTPMGSIVAGLMEEGVQMGISSRGLGDMKESNGARVVQKYRMLSAGDIVSDPSGPDAYLTNLMENKEWVFANGVLVEQTIDEAKKELNTLAKSKKLNEENMLKLFHHILAQIK